ncbi:NUDIX domain-containing protein [Aestuariirhabdus litorea]|uniref:nicotinate-nucleotide adenylyltransferase n=1 Tax=Aestuariirhabdus litorea TaxID=2528527 RepID=A0A3P3VKZ9_9GAMM|nr:NUDIX domain-containing protein [Aestuariirhabdus litorea]RRJ82548.1 NUDIX domain-containing protein [Aestuariirhabdus litorea]RWW92709.1 NUDIX domain-containing protein [Endozoicomonadaceae bacterium GTF-13]
MFRVGILGSAFDPPTRGHIDLLQQAAPEFDRILLVPSARHAFGKRCQPMSHRIAMLEALLDPLSLDCELEICTLEQHMAERSEQPVYTYDLMEALEQQLIPSHPDLRLCFIRGPDNAHPKVWSKFHRAQEIEQRWQLFTAEERTPVRSTSVRELLGQAGDPDPQALRALVPDAIADYLLAHHLYRPSLLAREPAYGDGDVRLIRRERCYDGFFKMDRYHLQHRRFEGGWTPPLSRELFHRTKAVAMLPVDLHRRRVVLVEQFRIGAYAAGLSPWMLEIVAGILEEGESPAQLVKREALEEAGLEVKTLIPICEYLPSPGGSSEELEVFCGLVDASAAGGLHGLEEEGEDIRVHSISIDQALALLQAGELNNAATIIALQWLQLNLDRLLKEYRP